MRILKIGVTAVVFAVALGLAWGIWNIRSHGFSAREKPAAYEVFLARHDDGNRCTATFFRD